MTTSFNKKIDNCLNNNIKSLNRICSCSKTKCIKKYCECLSNNQYCYNCNCIDCHNKPDYTKKNLRGEKEIVSCTCTKSNCNKKYCECYKIGEKCNDNCRCINCLNNEEAEKKKFEKKTNLKYELAMERISILIEDKKIYVDIQPVSFDTFSSNGKYYFIKEMNDKKLLNQKRNRFLCTN